MWKTLRKSLWLLLLIGLTSTAVQATDPRLWDTTGVAIRQGYEINWQRSAEMDEGGNVVFAWSDTRNGERQIYAQKVDPAGNKLWGGEGLRLASYPGLQQDPALIPTGDGNTMIVWKDCRLESDAGDLFGQYVSSDGSILWDSSGVLLATADFDFTAEMDLVADGTGGAYIFWIENSPTSWYDVYAIRILADGSVAPYWPAAGLAIAQAPYLQFNITACTDGAGGVLIAWRDERNQVATGSDIYIQRVTPDGNLAWTPHGVIVCDTLEDQRYPKICPTGSGGAYVVWHDERQDYDGDLYFQIVSSSGTLLLPESQGRPLIVLPLQQEKPQIVADGLGNAIIAWQDTRDDPIQNWYSDIYAQKVNSGGNLLWQSNGVPVCTAPGDQTDLRLDADGAGNVICAWTDGRDELEWPPEDIYAQKINSDGSLSWTTNGILVCDAPWWQSYPQVQAAAAYSMIAWSDMRSGSSGVWYQKLNAFGVPQLAVNGDTLIWGISGDARNPVLVPGDQGYVFIFYEDGREGIMGPSIFVQMMDMQGNMLLETNGRLICPEPAFTSYKPQDDPDACSDGSGGAIAVWLDSRDSNPVTQIYAQRINAAGELAWGSAGVQVSSSALESPGAPKIVEDGSGGGIVAWSEISTTGYDYDLHAARLSHDGDLVWSDSVAAVPGEDETVQDLAGDGNGGVYVAYRGAMWPEFNIYAQHLDASGNLLWGQGVSVCADTGNQTNCRIASLGSDGVIFIWQDERDAVTWAIDLYAQKLNWAGTPVWQDEGIPVCQYAQDQVQPDLSLDGQGHLNVIWSDFRNGYDEGDLYIQKLTMDGLMLFGSSGLPVCNASETQSYPRILSDNGGGNYVFWRDWRNLSNEDVYGLHLDGEGLPYASWTANGNLACSNPYQQQAPVAIGDFAHGAIVVWPDARPSDPYYYVVTNLYAQRMNDLSLSAPPVPRNEPLYPEPMLFAGPNPTNPLTVIRCLLPQPGFMELSIFDISGRLVEKLASGMHGAGVHSFTWNAKDKASGVYIVRLKTPLADKSTKLVMIK